MSNTLLSEFYTFPGKVILCVYSFHLVICHLHYLTSLVGGGGERLHVYVNISNEPYRSIRKK